MDYKDLPPEGRAGFGQIMEDMLKRAGEEAVVGFARLGALLNQLKAEYSKEPTEEEAAALEKLGSRSESADAAFLEAIQIFFDALGEDEEIQRLQAEHVPVLEQIESGAARAAILRTVERLKNATPDKLPSIAGRRVKDVGFPIDKVNANIWKLLEKDMGGQIAIAAESKKSKKQLNIYYSINFDELGRDVTITRKLEPFDKRVYIAIGALWAAGSTIITEGQIYDAMGYSGEPGAADRQHINESLAKMGAAHIYINNAEEAKAYRYAMFVYDASLLPFERLSTIINGRTVDSAIHLFREPPLITFARGRKQITTIKRQLLSTPLNKTNSNIMLEDYLLERIAHARSGKLSAKIKYATIFEEARITETKQKQRAPAKIKKLLDYYRECGHIKGYTVEADGVRLSL